MPEDLADALAAALDLAVVGAVEPELVARAVVPEAADVEPLAAGVEEAPEAVAAPLIWAWTVALKVPVIPVRLFKF